MSEGFLIVSDLDGTLLGDDAALEKFAAWFEPRRDQFQLVYNSGRFPDSIRKSIATSALPRPDAVIGGVGSEIEFFDPRVSLEGWPEHIDHWDANVVRRLLAIDRRLKLQPEEFLSPRKVSYYAHQATKEELGSWERKLQSSGIRARIIYSSQRDLDFLPAGCDKGRATAFLAKHWGYSNLQVIASGDTGNDSAFFEQGFLGTIVGNALPELKALKSPMIYHARAGFAAGVQEGLEYWLEQAALSRDDADTPARMLSSYSN